MVEYVGFDPVHFWREIVAGVWYFHRDASKAQEPKIVLIKIGEVICADFINVQAKHLSMTTPSRDKSQADKFRELARELETDESKERFDERLRKIAKSAPPKREDKPKKDKPKKDKPGQ